MITYIVMEIQTNSDGTVGNFVFAYTNRDEAEAKMHTILASAAVSNLPRHAAVLFDNNGTRLDGKVYLHDISPEEPEEEPEA